MKRLFVFLLALLLFVGVTAVLSSCDDAPSEEIRFRRKDDGTYAVDIQNATHLSEIEVPATYNGKAVTEIGAFDGAKSVGNKVLARVIIPDSVTSISDFAFKDCTSLTSITIPDSVTSIGAYAFSGCTALTGIAIPEGVVHIGVLAFSDCTRLTRITIPDSITSVGHSAFSGCTNLLYTEYNNAHYLGNEENPYAVLVKAKCDSLSTCRIHESTRVIYDSAFKGCTDLTDLTIPEGVTIIGSYAFQNCTGLKSVTLAESVTKINSFAFEYCTGITSITLPKNLTTIEYCSFLGCTRLESITIPEGVTSIVGAAFSDCTALASIQYRGSEREWRAIKKGRDWNKNTGSYTVTYDYTGE